MIFFAVFITLSPILIVSIPQHLVTISASIAFSAFTFVWKRARFKLSDFLLFSLFLLVSATSLGFSTLYGTINLDMCFHWAALFFILISARLMASELNSQNAKHYRNTILIIVLFWAFLSHLNIDLVPQIYVVYKEPSHAGVAFVPLLVFAVASTKGWEKAIAALGLLMVIYSCAALSTIAALVLSMALFFKWSKNIFFGFLLVAVLLLNFDTTYYSDRIFDLAKSSGGNISSTVYLSGWQDAIMSLNMYALGSGLGTMGYTDIELSEARLSLMDRRLGHLNFNDGSFLMSKLTSELGVFGFIFGLIPLVSYVFLFFRKFCLINNPLLGLGAAFLVSFNSYMYIRGAGYFSPVVFLGVVGLLICFSQQTTSVKTGA